MPETVRDEFPPIDAVAAAAALDHTKLAQTTGSQAVRAGSSWTSRFLGAFGIASVVFISLTGTLPDVGGAIAYVTSWVIYGAIATWFARREKVSWRGFDRLSGKSFRAWFVLQAAGCAVGFNYFAGVAAYWVPVALVVSAPLFIGAWSAAHQNQ
jgi:hypothetical protein